MRLGPVCYVAFMLATVVALAVMQNANPDKASYLLEPCRSYIRVLEARDPTSNEADLFNAQYCKGYFQGFTAFIGDPASSVCLGTTPLPTLVRTYLAFMASHPKAMDEPEATGAYAALLTAYPCPKR